ncbi:hypothetical protein [Ideonella sp. YS5]|uniref:hypothetical protein n=1 Tax=Ideonella sp. YS5 TaxID=3453714 RepID=UPI003EE842A6
MLIGAVPASHAIGIDAISRCAGDAACLSGLELAALRDSRGSARREGAELILQAGMQAPARFIDQPALSHRYLGRLDGLQLHVVRVASASQRPAWWLLADGGQAPLRVDALPIGGPGGRHFVMADGNSLALYQRSGARWSLQFRLDAPAGLSWAVKGWRADGAAVRLEWIWPEAPSACAGQAAQGQLQLRDGPYGWDLVPEAPHRC